MQNHRFGLSEDSISRMRNKETYSGKIATDGSLRRFVVKYAAYGGRWCRWIAMMRLLWVWSRKQYAGPVGGVKDHQKGLIFRL